MLRPTVKEVQPMAEYHLKLIFDNGEIKVFDVRPYIKGSWYMGLEDSSYFKTVKTDGFTVVWPDGQDLCPDELYTDSKPLL